MTREDVQEQYGAAPDEGGPRDRMADEIVRLREQLERAEAERITAEMQLEREQRTSESLLGMSQMYEKEYERARDILAALREPSKAVLTAAHKGFPYKAAMLRAAVAAAEQEVAS